MLRASVMYVLQQQKDKLDILSSCKHIADFDEHIMQHRHVKIRKVTRIVHLVDLSKVSCY